MNANKEHSHSFLVENCIKGSREYQKALYKQYSPALFSLCLFFTENRSDAEIVLQEVFVAVFSKLHSYNKEESLDAWIEKIFADSITGHLYYKRLVII